tara:strand:- start:682 stop:996 length:315 start_codon:yes stop_codon:yes gene_type:complete
MKNPNEKINKICKDYDLRYAVEKAMKKHMTVEEIKFCVKYDDLDYTLRVEPKGNGYYKVRCTVYNKRGQVLGNYVIEEYHSYGISLNFAKNLVISFSVHHNKSK